MRLLLLLISLILPSFANGYMRNVPGDGMSDADRIAINNNFRVLDAMASRSTVKGYSRLKTGTITAPSSTGSQSYTGVGFRPRAIIFFGPGTATAGTLFDLNLGVTDCSTSFTVGGLAEDGGTVGGHPVNTSQVIRQANSSGGDSLVASLTSCDTDGFTINFSTVPAFTQTVGYLAFQ